MAIPRPIKTEPANSVHTEPNTLRNNPKLRIISAYNKNLLILSLCEKRLTSTEQLANINKGIEVSRLL
jgi:hypothetical protein